MRSKASGDHPPVLRDALIPGRFYTKRELTQQPSAEAVLARPHGWKLLWWYWLGFWLFWAVACALGNSFHMLILTAFALLTPFFVFSIPMLTGLVLLFPGTYVMWLWQARSIKAVSTHIVAESHSTEMILRSRAWLTFWRAVFLPGRDLGHLTNPALGRIVGFLQVTWTLVAPLTYSTITVLNLVTDGMQRPHLAYSVTRSLMDFAENVLPGPAAVALLTLSAMLFVTNMVCAHKYVTRAADMNPDERAGLTP